MDWPHAIKLYRIKHRTKQEALALELGVNQATISRWERGIDEPNFFMQAKLKKLISPEKIEQQPGIIQIVSEPQEQSLYAFKLLQQNNLEKLKNRYE